MAVAKPTIQSLNTEGWCWAERSPDWLNLRGVFSLSTMNIRHS